MVEILKKGEIAPDFELLNQDGKKVKLYDLKNKYKILYFYPKDGTKGCTTEALDFSDKIVELKDKGAVVIGVSKDSVKSHKNFAEKYWLKQELLSDESTEIVRKYGVWQIKKIRGKDYEGVVRMTYLIDENNKVVHVWEKVKLATHVKDVIEKIKELG